MDIVNNNSHWSLSIVVVEDEVKNFLDNDPSLVNSIVMRVVFHLDNEVEHIGFISLTHLQEATLSLSFYLEHAKCGVTNQQNIILKQL